eukprot:tig00000849_g4742.t1
MLFFGHYRVHIVREDYTSKTCGNCGHIHSKLRGNKVFCCPACGATMDRDFNGARNITLRKASGADDADGEAPPLEVAAVDVDVPARARAPAPDPAPDPDPEAPGSLSAAPPPAKRQRLQFS